jgi:hypothetical protein
MDTKKKSDDYTFQANGPMAVFFRNDADQRAGVYNGTRWGGTGIDPTKVRLQYLPIVQPPPPWVQNTDWSIAGAPAQPFPYQAMPSRMGQGSVQPLYINERGPAKVVSGASYLFDQPITPGSYTLISLHFKIVGVPGGSTVVPGFGLFNLISNPNAWSYIYPMPGTFDGDWSIQLRSVDFYDLMTLRASYVRSAFLMGVGLPVSRLCYQISGSSMVALPIPNNGNASQQKPDEDAAHEPGALEVIGDPSGFTLATE